MQVSLKAEPTRPSSSSGSVLAEGSEGFFARIANGIGRLMAHGLREQTMACDVAALARRAGVKAMALHQLIFLDDPAFGSTLAGTFANRAGRADDPALIFGRALA